MTIIALVTAGSVLMSRNIDRGAVCRLRASMAALAHELSEPFDGGRGGGSIALVYSEAEGTVANSKTGCAVPKELGARADA